MIVGLDFSTRAIHLCELPEDSNEARLHVVRLDTERGNYVDRARRLRDRMPARSAYTDNGITLVAIEKPFSRQPNGLIPMMLVYGGILQLLPADVPLLELSAPEWRKECSLPQRGDDVKPAAIRFARQCWTDPPAALDDNGADAFCVAWAAREIDLRREVRPAA